MKQNRLGSHEGDRQHPAQSHVTKGCISLDIVFCKGKSRHCSENPDCRRSGAAIAHIPSILSEFRPTDIPLGSSYTCLKIFPRTHSAPCCGVNTRILNPTFSTGEMRNPLRVTYPGISRLLRSWASAVRGAPPIKTRRCNTAIVEDKIFCEALTYTGSDPISHLEPCFAGQII